MASPEFPLDRRELMAGLGAAALAPMWPAAGARPGADPRWRCRPEPTASRSRPGAPDTPIWSLQGPELRFKRGETLEVAFGNELPVPAVLNWRGIDGVPAAEPLAARAPLAGGGKDALQLPLRHAGTFLCDLGLLGDGQARPSRARPLVVRESEPVAVDRDEVLLIEDWRVRPDGTAIAPGAEPKDAAPVLYGQRPDFVRSLSPNQRARQTSLHQWLSTRCYCNENRELRGPRDGHRRPAGRAVPGPQRRAGAGAGRPGRCLRRRHSAGRHFHSDPPARRQGGPPDRQARRLQRAADPPGPAARRPRRCPPTACPSGSTSRTPPGSICRSAVPRRLGDARQVQRHRPARLPRQGRPRRGAGADQPRRHRHRLPPARPSFPAAGPARRRLEAVLAGYAGDRARPDPAHRLRWPNMPGAS